MSKKNEMKIEEGLVSEDHTEGFCTIEHFEGETALIDIEKITALMEFVMWSKKRGATKIRVGISKEGMFIVFLDKTKTVGYVIGPVEV